MHELGHAAGLDDIYGYKLGISFSNWVMWKTTYPIYDSNNKVVGLYETRINNLTFSEIQAINNKINDPIMQAGTTNKRDTIVSPFSLNLTPNVLPTPDAFTDYNYFYLSDGYYITPFDYLIDANGEKLYYNPIAGQKGTEKDAKGFTLTAGGYRVKVSVGFMIIYDPSGKVINSGMLCTPVKLSKTGTFTVDGYYFIPDYHFATPNGYIYNPVGQKISFDGTSMVKYPLVDEFFRTPEGYKIGPDMTVIDRNGTVLNQGSSTRGGEDNQNEPYTVVSYPIYANLSTSEAVDYARIIVSGEVIKLSETKKYNDDVYRIATIQIAENMYGAIGAETVDVLYLGGVYDGVDYTYLDSIKYNQGERVTVILEETPVSQNQNMFATKPIDQRLYFAISDEFAYPATTSMPFSTRTSPYDITSIIREMANQRKLNGGTHA